MPKQELLIQLIMEGRPAWQVRAEVSKSICRKMTNSELAKLGNSVINELSAIIQDSEVSEEKPAAAPEASRKKR